MLLKGAMTALVTPMRDGQVDYDRLASNVAFQIAEGIDGLVPVGTTGESPTLSHDEHDKVIDTVVQSAAGRVPVIAGTGSNASSTAGVSSPSSWPLPSSVCGRWRSRPRAWACPLDRSCWRPRSA